MDAEVDLFGLVDISIVHVEITVHGSEQRWDRALSVLLDRPGCLAQHMIHTFHPFKLVGNIHAGALKILFHNIN